MPGCGLPFRWQAPARKQASRANPRRVRVAMEIRPAVPSDLAAMWEIFQEVIVTGDTLPFPVDFDRGTFQSHWFGAQATYLAADGSDVLGMYKYGANYPGPGSHVASATYLVRPAAQGRGIGRALVEDSLARAGRDGHLAMQFNYVVSSNTAAVELYRKLGFAVVGTLPGAFRHRQLGLVDAYVMHRFLQPQGAAAT